MIQRVHPLTGEPKPSTSGQGMRPDLQAFGLTRQPRRSRASYDAAHVGTDLDNHWAHADALDADNANNRTARHRLMQRSRYEGGSNGYYAGIIDTHTNMVYGVGPTLRMLTKNKIFNQLVEREWGTWCEAVQLHRKLWCMTRARTADGETIALFTNNPDLGANAELDIMLIEAEQCQSMAMLMPEAGQVDGLKFDPGTNNVVWYDILPEHPGSNRLMLNSQPERVPAASVLHWYKLRRPGTHRGIPDLTPTLNAGAIGRRFREATATAAESAADISALIHSQLSPAGDDEAEPVQPLSTFEFQRRMLMALPMGWDARQMKGEHPNAEYAEFHRQIVSELARPISMPYNAAACDSSTYSFASGKLDTLCYRASIDVERRDCGLLILDRIFAAWFREWTIISDNRLFMPVHQWDWPVHPVIDAAAEAAAIDTKLKNGSVSMRRVFTDAGMDLEDELVVMAEDYFGDGSEENVTKMRQIMLLRNLPLHVMPYAAKILGISIPKAAPPGAAPPAATDAAPGDQTNGKPTTNGKPRQLTPA